MGMKRTKFIEKLYDDKPVAQRGATFVLNFDDNVFAVRPNDECDIAIGFRM